MASISTEYTLDNGLSVFIIQDPSASLLAVRTYVRAGSINEAPFLGYGLSHYLEHLVAGGSTDIHTESYYKDLISNLGGAYNAYTTVDHTCYYINTVPKYLKESVHTLYEWMFFNSFNPVEYAREREVITKEIEKTQASVHSMFYQTAQDNFFKVSPIKYPVIGYLENFKQIPLDALKHYYKTYYLPSNMALVIAGNIDVQATLSLVKSTFGTIPYLAPPLPVFGTEPPVFSKRWLEKEGKTSATYLSVRFPGVTIFSGDLYALDLLDFILGNGEDSILNRELVDKQHVAYSVHTTSYTPSFVNGYFDITLEIDESKKELAYSALLKILDNIKKGNILEKEITRAKRQKLADDILGISTIEDQAERVGQGFIYAHDKEFYSHYVDRFKSVQKADVIRIVSAYCNPDKSVVTVFKPTVASPTQNSLVPSSSIEEEKKFQKITLSNGIRVLLYPDPSSLKATVKVFTLGGVFSETPSKNGVSYLLSDLWGKRSKRYSKAKIYDLIEGHGSELNGMAGQQTMSLSLHCLAEDFDTLLPVWIDTCLNPLFSEEDFVQSKEKLLQRIMQRKDDWMSCGGYEFKKFFFGQHPYSLSVLGEQQSVEACSVRDISDHWKNHIIPSQMVIVAIGNIDAPSFLSRIKQSFEALPPSLQTHLSPTTSYEKHVAYSEKTVGFKQPVTALFMGFDGLKYSEQDAGLTLAFLDCILTGANYPGGRLHTILRDNGLVYVVHGNQFQGIKLGYFLIYALTSDDKLDAVKQHVSDQIDDLKKKPISDEEFQQAFAQLEFYFQDRVSSQEALSLIAATDELYGNGYLSYTGLIKKLRMITKEDIQEAANRYLNSPQLLILRGSH